MKKVYWFLGLLIAGQIACSSKPKEIEAKKEPTPAASIEAKQLANEEQTSHVVEITFRKGASQLTAKAKSEIQALMGEAERSGQIEQVEVVTWSDVEYPSVHTKKLSKQERDLVSARNKELEKFFGTMPGQIKVVAHSMAERPNALSELINTSDARVKKSLETAGIPNGDTAVKIPSKASKSIVMAILKK